jgi:hypothetical protein
MVLSEKIELSGLHKKRLGIKRVRIDRQQIVYWSCVSVKADGSAMTDEPVAASPPATTDAPLPSSQLSASLPPSHSTSINES